MTLKSIRAWLGNKKRNFRYRLGLIYSALFRRLKDMPHSQHIMVPAPAPIAWANVFDLLPNARSWSENPRPEFLVLCRTPSANIESSEPDTAHLLYDLVRWRKPQRVIEVGIAIGAGSLHLAQGLADNGGGELHLVDMNADRLSDVEAKIHASGLSVSVCTHCGKSNTVGREGNLPQAELIFLDAEHDYEPTSEELAVYFPLLSENGFLVLHDSINWEGVTRAVNELARAGRLIFTIGSSGGSGVSIITKQTAPMPVVAVKGLTTKYIIKPQ